MPKVSKLLSEKGRARGVRQRKRNVHGQFCCALPCYIQHFSADVHGDNPATGSIGKIPSRSHRDFENVSSRMPQESPPEFSNSKEIRDSLDKIVPTRKSIVLLGQLSGGKVHRHELSSHHVFHHILHISVHHSSSRYLTVNLVFASKNAGAVISFSL